MWLREGSRPNSAPAMPLARRRPSDTGTTWSPEACNTRVGVFTRGRNAQASISARAASSFTAVSGVVDLRHISLNQPSCSALPSGRSEEHTSELQSLMRISYAVFCLTKKKNHDKQQL